MIVVLDTSAAVEVVLQRKSAGKFVQALGHIVTQFSRPA